MKLKRFTCLSVAGALLALPVPLSAHGGQYRGPGDTVPPNPGGGRGTPGPGGPTTPSPGGPSTPTPGGPSTPGPATPGPAVPTPGGGAPSGGGGRGPTTGGGGVSLGDGLDQWQFWWEFNKDPFLQLKQAIHSDATTTGSDDFIMGRGLKEKASNTLAPSKSDRKRIIEALKKALGETTNRDIISSALVGLAKVGGDRSILPVFKEYLPSPDQEKRETATVAMGIAALEEAVPDLIALAMDEPAGRKLVERSEVDFRTRSFACYGLGLIVYRTKNAELKQKVFEAMKTMVELGTNNRVHRDLIVAPLQSMRLLRPNVETPAGKSLRDDAIEFLSAYMAKPDKEVYAQIRSHAYIAAAELLGRGGDSTGLITTRMMEDVKNRRQKQWIHQSAILALGQIALPENLEVSTAIQDYMKRGKDLQAKYFCAIALGQIGGDKNRSFLISRIKRAKSLEKPWIAVGLAIMDYQVRSKDQNYEGDPTAAMAIKREFDRTKNQMYAAGMAIALGVMKHSDSGDAIMDRLLKVKSQDQPAGYMAVALGLMGYQDAKDTIKSLLETAKRRPKLLTQCAIALGLLGDKEVSTGLITFIQDKQVVAVYSAISQALGWIGDKRSINPLITMLQDKSIKELPRAFAAVALGLVGDKEELPWNSKIAVNNNYRANVETLTGNNGTGILDIL